MHKFLIQTSFKNLNIVRRLSTSQSVLAKEKCQVLIVGCGTGGCSMTAKLTSALGKGNVIVLEDSDKHFYQPMFTLIGGGMKKLEQSYKLMQNIVPKNARWIKEKAAAFDPKNNSVTTSQGRDISYDVLLIATGLQLNYDKVKGLEEALSIPNGNVASIYSPKYVNRTFEALKRFEKGNLLFTFPASPVKCPGAPQKIVYITEHYLRKNNKRKDAKIIYNTSLPVIFGVKRYADALWKVVEKRSIEVNLKRNLIEVRAKDNIAVFENLDKPDERIEVEYSFLHAVPPMSAPKELATCSDLVNSAGFVDVDKSTLQHVKFSNVFAIGDSSSSPNSKTAASAAAQSPVVYEHIISFLKGKKGKLQYDGYASCPLVTGYNSCILAEFDYDLKPLETFPFPQDKERWTMFIMKKDFMPFLYWQFMMKGYWNGPSTFRKLLSPFKFIGKYF